MSAHKPTPRVPPAVAGIQVNHCKNALCSNFGVPALQSRGRVEGGAGSYRLSGTERQGRVLTCHVCRQSTTMYSNVAVAEEVARFDPIRQRTFSASCNKPGCSSAGRSLRDFPGLYLTHGTTRIGEPRHRCKACGGTFSTGAPIRTQKRPELNREVLKLLVNKVPMRRICEVLDVNAATLYSKLGYLAEVTAQFSSRQEARLLTGEVSLARAYVSVDRQDHVLNWGSQLDRRNTALGAVGAVENKSGYVLAMQLNFDPECDPQDVEADAIAHGDYEVPPVHRRYARLWLRGDYEAAAGRATAAPDDIEEAERENIDGKPPHSGMQVHLGATYYGLFFHLKELLQHVERTRFFLDRDPGLDSACLAAFVSEVHARRVDAFIVKGGKELTVDKKKIKIAHANRELEQFIKRAQVPEGESARLHFVIDRLRTHMALADKLDWFEYPLADMADSSKAIQYLTNFGEYDIGHLANLYMLATLRGVDRFFMQVRRRLSLLERPIATANSGRRAWHGYAAYSPLVAQRILHIFRGYYNFCLVGEDHLTPAMRLGLIDHPVALDTLSGPPAAHGGK